MVGRLAVKDVAGLNGTAERIRERQVCGNRFTKVLLNGDAPGFWRQAVEARIGTHSDLVLADDGSARHNTNRRHDGDDRATIHTAMRWSKIKFRLLSRCHFRLASQRRGSGRKNYVRDAIKLDRGHRLDDRNRDVSRRGIGPVAGNTLELVVDRILFCRL